MRALTSQPLTAHNGAFGRRSSCRLDNVAPALPQPHAPSQAHLHQRDHSNAFWNEVDKVLPDYRERKEWLRVRGAQLDV